MYEISSKTKDAKKQKPGFQCFAVCNRSKPLSSVKGYRNNSVRYVHTLKGCRFYPHDSSWGLGYNTVMHAKVVKTWNFLLNYKKVMVLKYF